MRLIDRIKGALGFAPTIRNKPGGFAWIRGMTDADGDGVLNGRAVKTVRINELGMWVIDPPQRYIVKRTCFYPRNNCYAYPGDVATVIGLGDEFLEPWKDAGLLISDAEVRELFEPRLPAKETQRA